MQTTAQKESICSGSSRCRHYEKLATNMMYLMTSNTFCDITLVVDDVSFPCHKVILSAASTYFSAMFQSGMKEANADKVQLKFCEAETMKVLLEYFYTGSIAINEDNCQALIEAAGHLDLEDAKIDCETYMVSQTDSPNCIGFIRFAKAHDLKELHQTAQRHLLENFEEVVMKSEEFVEMSEDELVDLISDDRLNTQDEDLVFISVQKWVEASNIQRREIFPRIAKHIRFSFCSKEFLSQLVYGEPLLNNSDCNELLKWATYSAFLPQKQGLFAGWQPRLSYALKGTQSKLRSISQDSTQVALREYREESKQWPPLVQICGSREKDACVLIKNSLIVFGSGGQSDSVVTIDLTNCNKWSTLAPMLKAPYQSLAVPFGQYIYVFDGGHGFNCCGVTQVYNTNLKQWKMVSQMPCECSGGAAVVLNGNIYVFGGKIQRAMCYDPIQDKWDVLTPPTRTHDPASAAVWKGKILLNGSDSVEEYDLQIDCWVERPELVAPGSVHIFTTTR
ncbi:hypothetical protein CAPTEDRAFT_112974 [Capitella teleta]|uniref:BTB domain-containing protein n=1 Tax=Capitella teleta TaxID=283909 RepID=R7TKW6_CAPTE|nr:hypothetical protein CAPTEDRAFT_112974 [Capitella teleta]|eukprot:ELT91750.1 hypothetical protein CAPTEDRAFT_112974 [Capitella teleta]